MKRSSQAAGVFGRALPFSDGHFAAVSRENPRRGDVGTAPVSEKWNRAAAGGKGGRVDRREGNGNRKRLTNDVGRRADTELGSRQREGAEAAQTREVVAVQPAERRLHALVVGGTGMLRGLSLALAEEGRMVSVVARTPSRLQVVDRRGQKLSLGVSTLCRWIIGTAPGFSTLCGRPSGGSAPSGWPSAGFIQRLPKRCGKSPGSLPILRSRVAFFTSGAARRPIRSPGPGGRPSGWRCIQTFSIAK